uniref:Uncharacterized protein n=1 Tax=Timema douglasi TaxID=61478 RepID=A0A7R8ZGW0_TIMDO|nr:unnamed protein product [Timema douglasi]
MKFYMLNLTNPEEVRQGGQPILKEVGPYVYDEYRERVNIEKHEDGTISFQKKTSLFFNQEKSGDARQDDVVTIINVVLLSNNPETLDVPDQAGYLERRELTPPPLPVTHWLDQHWGLCLPPIRDGNRSYSLPLPERDLAISTLSHVYGNGITSIARGKVDLPLLVRTNGGTHELAHALLRQRGKLLHATRG